MWEHCVSGFHSIVYTPLHIIQWDGSLKLPLWLDIYDRLKLAMHMHG